MGSGIASQATAEPAGQPHQMGLIQGLIASRQLSPPQPESTGAVTQAEVSIQQDPIYTVITACHNILIQCRSDPAEWILRLGSQRRWIPVVVATTDGKRS